MNPELPGIMKEHEEFNQEMVKLEKELYYTVIDQFKVNQILRNLTSLWEKHEAKEERVFEQMQRKGFPIPLKKLWFEHVRFKRDRQEIINKIENHGYENTQMDLARDCKDLVKRTREHMSNEDWLISSLLRRKQA